ncbi:MAG TPA: zf-HC2 domain-containing protein [Mycobacteriales bacterium]|jgi:predicted anti-sigma-YlaC factor YlaD|nr:zf-HC2 domain-containing protein [Mycobacteriales bacterium]
MTIDCSDATVSLGAYVVGALDHAERAEIEAHLAHCPMCRDELAMLAPLPGLMSRLTADEAVAGPPALDAHGSAAMLDRLLAAAATERRRASRGRWLAAAAAVVVLAGAGTGAVVATRDQGAHWQQTAVAAAGPVHLTVKLADQANGTKIDMTMSGVTRGLRCSLVAIGRDGRTEDAGWWEATYEGTAHITGTTSIARKDLTQLKVVTDAGKTLVVAPV